MYAENFNLLPHIKFNTTVLKISILPDKRWNVKYIIQCENEEKEEIFDFVMVCTGKHRKPRWPEFKGMNLFKAYDHSPSRFTQYIIPPFIRGKIIENYIIKSFTYPPHLEPNDPIIATLPIINFEIFQYLAAGTVIVKPDIKELKSENNQIEFIDGTVLENIDVVIYATGFDIDFSFLDNQVFTGGDEIIQEFRNDFYNLVWLYKSIYPPKYPNIAFLGLSLGAPILPISEMQARHIIGHIKGFIKPLPSQYEMEKSIRNNYEAIRKNSCKHARSAIRQNYLSYLDSLSKDVGCYPYSYEIIKKFGFSFWKLIMFGIATPVQYRLLGRNSWEGAREAILLYNKNSFKPIAKRSKVYNLLIYILIISLILLKRNGTEPDNRPNVEEL
ncbi:1265_t:CDS:2, partial [Racocetra fulgida]